MKGDWKIRRDNESTDYTVDELCRLEAETKPDQKAVAPIASQDLGSRLDSANDGRVPRGAKMFFFISLYLIAAFLYRVLVTAHEYDSIPVVCMSIALDLAMVVSLILLKMAVSRGITTDQRSGVVSFVFVIALLAGLGLLGIRVTSNESWRTGHLRYDCCPKVESIQPRSR